MVPFFIGVPNRLEIFLGVYKSIEAYGLTIFDLSFPKFYNILQPIIFPLIIIFYDPPIPIQALFLGQELIWVAPATLTPSLLCAKYG